MTYLMVNERIVIHHLVLVGDDTTIAEALSTLTLEHQVETVASDTIMKGNHIVVDTAVSLLLNIDIADTAVLNVSLLQAIKVEACILAHICLNHLSGKEVAVVSGMVAE